MQENFSYPTLINSARVELESAGNPSFAIAMVFSDGTEIVPVVFATLKPAVVHADRMKAGADAPQAVYIVGRHVEGDRIAFTVMDSRSRKLHTQFEIVERSFAEEDKPL